MFRMDTIVKNLVEVEYQKYASKCSHLSRVEIETMVLGQLETAGKAMRYLRRDGKTIAWKATPKMRQKIADYEAKFGEVEDYNGND
jgi:hypothetical protein